MEPKDCKYYREGTVCDRCTLEITEQDIEDRWKVLSNLEDAKTWKDIEFGCAQIHDALMYLVWDSPDDADFDKHERLVGGQAVIIKFNKPGEPFKSWYEYNIIKTCIECGKKLNSNNKSGYCDKHYKLSNKYKSRRKKYWKSDKGKAIIKKAQKKYNQTDKRKAALKKYKQSDKGKAAEKKYKQSDKGKAVRKKYNKSDKGKELRRKANRKQYLKNKNKK